MATASRRRHCMVVHAYYPLGETRVQREALALVHRGYEVDVLCLRGPGEPATDVHEGITVRRLPVRRHRRPGYAFSLQLLEYLTFFVLAGAVLTVRHLRRRYGSVQVHNLPDFLVFAALVPKLSGARIVLDLHDLSPEFFEARAGDGARGRLVSLVRWQERVACRFADHVVTVTDGWCKTLVARGVPAEKLSVVMNVADPRLFTLPASPAGSGRTGFRVLYHGTFTHRYGVDLLLDAVALVRDEIPDLSVQLLGDGEARSELVARRARLGLDDCVEISGGMADAAVLPAVIAAAHVGVVPHRSSVFTDGLLPTKLLEYVAMGTPVIASRTPMVAAYFDDDMLQFFEPGDAEDLAKSLRLLAEDHNRREALARCADAFNHRYDWHSMADRYAALVGADAVGSRPSGRWDGGRSGRGPTPRRPGRAKSGRVPAGSRPSAGYEVVTSDADDEPQWDEFLAHLPGGHHTQTSLWAQAKASLGWSALRVVARADDDIVGGAQILYRRVPPMVTVGYVARGPVLRASDPVLARLLMDAVETASRSAGIRHLSVQPPGTDDTVPTCLARRPYLASETELAPRATVLLDVTHDPEVILAEMASKTRYNVRLSGRRGVTVRDGGREDLGTYHELLVATGRRQGFEPLPKHYFLHLWDVFAPRGHLRLALAEYEGQAVAGQLAIAFGDTVVNKLSVWSGQAGNRRPNEALQWSAIQWAHAHGYRIYDFEGLKLRAAQAHLRGEPLPSSAAQSVTSFKLGFGGNVVVMPPARIFIPNPVLRWSYGQVYPRISHARSVKAAVKRLRTNAPS